MFQNIPKKKSFRYFDEAQFYEEVKKLSWWQVYSSTDVDSAVHIFTEKINIILDQMAPIRIFQTRKKYVPWLEKGTKLMMHRRDNLLSKAKATKLKEDWKSFRQCRNYVTMKLKKRQGGMAENNFTKLSERFRKIMAKCFGMDKMVNLRIPIKIIC